MGEVLTILLFGAGLCLIPCTVILCESYFRKVFQSATSSHRSPHKLVFAAGYVAFGLAGYYLAAPLLTAVWYQLHPGFHGYAPGGPLLGLLYGFCVGGSLFVLTHAVFYKLANS